MAPQIENTGAAHRFDGAFLTGMHDLVHIDLRKRVVDAMASHDDGGNDGEGERESNNDARALAEATVDLHMTAEHFDVCFYDIHPDAASRDVAHYGRCGESRREDELEGIGI